MDLWGGLPKQASGCECYSKDNLRADLKAGRLHMLRWPVLYSSVTLRASGNIKSTRNLFPRPPLPWPPFAFFKLFFLSFIFFSLFARVYPHIGSENTLGRMRGRARSSFSHTKKVCI